MTQKTQPTQISAEPGVPFVDVVREFNAPPEAVYRAHVDAELFAQWMGPRDMKMDQVELDAVVGGRWMYEFRSGSEAAPMPMRFFGVFHAVEPNARIVQTFEFSLAPGLTGISTTLFKAVGGGTRLTVHEVYPSVESRDMAVASGMEYGINEGYERLDALLAS